MVYVLFSLILSAKDYELIDRILVTVEKEVITTKEVQMELFSYSKKIDFDNLVPSEKKKIEKQVIDLLIKKKLIFQYGENKNLTPSNNEIEIVISNILQNNEIEIDELKNQLIAEGSNLDIFKNDLKYQILIQKIKDKEIMPYINISDYEIDAWIKNKEKNSDDVFKITHLLIKKNNQSQNLILEKINKIKKNDEFKNLAKEYSDGPNAENYGDLGWKKLNELPEIFIEFIKQAKEGEISGPIKSSNGIHIIKIESIKKVSIEKKIMVKQYKFQQILLKHNEITEDLEQEKKLNTVLNLINDGLDFSKAIKLYSDEQFNNDPSKLEWVYFNNLLPEFKLKLSEYPVKKIIGPFKTQLGWHLVKVYDFRESDETENSERENVKIEIARKKTEFRFDDWFDALLKNSKIKYFNED